MSFKIASKKSVARDLKRIDKDQSARILSKIDKELPGKAESFPLLSGKFSGLREFRVGDFRVIYSIIGDTAIILRISHRREAYQK